MNQRIRYRETEIEGMWTSVRKFTPASNNGARYFVNLNMSTIYYEIIEDSTLRCVKSGKAINNQYLKAQVKNALVSLGVVFEEKEVRKNYKKHPTKTNSKIVSL